MGYDFEIKLLPISLERSKDYLRWFNDNEVVRFLEPTTPKTKKEICEWLKKISTLKKFKYFSIFLIKQNKYLGHAGLKNINLVKKQAEVGIVIGEKKFWQKGIGTKALSKIIDCSRELKLKKLLAEVQKENLASLKLFSKLGLNPYL